MLPITDGVVTLRGPAPSDREILVSAHDEVARGFLGDGAPDPAPVAVVVVAGEIVGWVDHDDRDWLAPHECNLGYLISPAHRGRGHASRAVQLLLDHLAVEGRYSVATLLIDRHNERSLALATRLGFPRVADLDGNPFFKVPIGARPRLTEDMNDGAGPGGVDHGRPVEFGPVCDTPVERAAMVHWWDDLTFLHWRFAPTDVQRLLPPGLTVQTFDGSAWVGLVPFFLRVGLPGVPSVPWLSRFAETNVRTYVTGPGGQQGIWFFSLDAARLGAVVVARSTYRLPYFWSRMSIERSGSVISYRSARRWPGPRGVVTDVAIDIGEPFAPDELHELDHFLTARWALFSAPRSGLRRALAFHEPWPLHRAEALHVDDGLVRAAGLPQPVGDPIVHWSPSVHIRIGWPAHAGRP